LVFIYLTSMARKQSNYVRILIPSLISAGCGNPTLKENFKKN